MNIVLLPRLWQYLRWKRTLLVDRQTHIHELPILKKIMKQKKNTNAPVIKYFKFISVLNY